MIFCSRKCARGPSLWWTRRGWCHRETEWCRLERAAEVEEVLVANRLATAPSAGAAAAAADDVELSPASSATTAFWPPCRRWLSRQSSSTGLYPSINRSTPPRPIVGCSGTINIKHTQITLKGTWYYHW